MAAIPAPAWQLYGQALRPISGRTGRQNTRCEASHAGNSREKLRRDYEAYLRNERGLSEKTICKLWYLIVRFLKFRFGDDMGDLSKITPINIAGFMQNYIRERNPIGSRPPPRNCGGFFQFLFRAGKTKNNLSLGIPA